MLLLEQQVIKQKPQHYVGAFPYKLLIVQVLKDTNTIQGIHLIFVCPPGLDGEILWSTKTTHFGHRTCGDIELELSWKHSYCRLVCTMLEGAM